MAIFQWRTSNNNTSQPSPSPSSSPSPSPEPQQPPPQPSIPHPPPPSQSPPPPTFTSLTSARSLKQLSFVALGGACILASNLLTRRAVRRRNLRPIPKFFEPNTNPHEHFSPFMDAMQALNLATLNSFSVGGFLIAGTLWAFDVSGLEELRRGLRGRLGYEAFENDGDGKGEEDGRDKREGLEEGAARRREELDKQKGDGER